jgi:ABC-type cobalamin/Fe3+-siderophores transport system ATPase subunit
MRSFKNIQAILGTQPAIKKIYLIGCTGAGKTSLVQHIIGSKKYDFPVTTHRRTTIAPTEYIIRQNTPFKTTIILKKEEDVLCSIQELVEAAILKAKLVDFNIEDVVFELEQSSDERFKLNQMVSKESFEKIAADIIDNIIPTIKNKDINDETLFADNGICKLINVLVIKLLDEIKTNFNNVFDGKNQLFTEPTVVITGISDKDDFLIENKKLLSHEFGSISILAEYVRIEGNLIADWLDKDLEFMLIDGEGIGHTLAEKADTLSARHYDYFNYCNNILLVDDANNPFSGGGKGAIEGIVLNGYEKKFKLIFSKVDKLDHSDLNAYFRRNINNLKNALSKDDIDFNYENKNTFKLSSLNGKTINEDSKKSIKTLLSLIDSSKDTDPTPLDYDFNLLFQSFSSDNLKDSIHERIDSEHWAVIKAFSRRLNNQEIEYKHLKPLSWILMFIMQEINHFLKKDALSSDILDSQNAIKQKFSRKIIDYIYENFICNKQHLWQQAYEKVGVGSSRQRKDFIFEQILDVFLPSKSRVDAFDLFRNDIKRLLMDSGAHELKTAKKTVITHVSIKKIFGIKNIEWTLGQDTNVLIGKNGCGKSTILKLIYACIYNDKETIEEYGSPYIELTLLKTFDNGETQESKVSHSKTVSNVHVEKVNTFDIKSEKNDSDLIDLDSQLLGLSGKFGEYQRALTQIVQKKVGTLIEERDNLLNNIVDADKADLERFQALSIEINSIRDEVNKPIYQFKTLIDGYFNGTNKTLIIDNEDTPLLAKIKDITIKISDLSSGEKQLLIIFLTVLLQKGRFFILLMDEPETSLHVEWQATFIDEIKKLNSNIQIIVATHNPLILLNREQHEIGVIEADEDEVQKQAQGTKYLDISSILLQYFGLASLIGTQMQADIKRFNQLKLQAQELTEEEASELKLIEAGLAASLAGDIIYDKKYFAFLKFLKEEKQIDIEEYQESTEEEMAEFLKEYGVFSTDAEK